MEIVTAQPEVTAPEPAPQVENCIDHDPQTIYNLLIAEGLPRVSALQLTGSFRTEGRHNPCQQQGDSGLAWGLNSWHPARRYDMPFDLKEQIHWAVHVELPRDCRSCYESLLAGGDKWSMREAIYRWTRWGELGRRWEYADQYEQMF